MNSSCLFFIFVLSVPLGIGLKCLKCPFTVFNIPCITSTVTCNANETCATIHGQASGHELIMQKGCISNTLCNTVSSDIFLGVNYTTSYTCCSGDFCNSAIQTKLSLLCALTVLASCLQTFL
ncbi:protein Bouncer-like [Protopterus annectens]|uniref:protein Bouncer-like n=1 Tax=Protopterus annectens TaxID=7888 RepID=UPI001CF99244|nr:protein Bouncer-like [Protopterus annectens]